MEGDVAEPFARVAPGVDVIVLHATRCCYLHTLRLDERGKRAGNAEPAAREVLLRQEYAVQQAVRVVPQEGGCQRPAVDRTLREARYVVLQQLEEGPVAALQDVGAVDPMCLHDRAGQVLSILLDPDIAEALERRSEIVRRVIPADGFQAVRHALRALDQDVRRLTRLVDRSAEIGKAGGLEARALHRLELHAEQQPTGVTERREVDAHGRSSP